MKSTRQLTISAMSLALGIILPQAFHMVPNAGSIFLPMHMPVIFGAYFVSPIYAFIVGILCPLVSHIVFQMPTTAMLGQMVVELGAYGLCASLLNRYLNIRKDIIKTYAVLVISMLVGRMAYGIMNCLFFKAGEYSLSIWLSSAFVTCLPGIMIQIILIPILVVNARRIY